jgi:hypothetical protein
LITLGDFRGDHRFPRRIVVLDSPQDVARENVQDAFVEIVELLDAAALDQVAIQMLQIAGHFQILHGAEFARGRSRSGYT